MNAAPLIDAAVIGPLRHAPGRSVLVAVAIALGVALGVAVHLINRSAADEVSRAARSLYGLADLVIEGGSAGFDEQLYPLVARTAGVASVSPVVEVEAKLAGRPGTLRLLGIDPLRSGQMQPALLGAGGSVAGTSALDPGGVHLSSNAARGLDLAAGDVLRLQIGLERLELQVASVLPPAALEGWAGIVDIATAQWRGGMLGRLTRLDLRLAPGAQQDQVRERLEALLPDELRVATPGQASDEAVRLSRAYRSNLMALGLVALFTGGFFVYSTQALATLRRRRQFALLHALGVTRAQQLALSLAGAALVGACGAALGLLLGEAIASLGLAALTPGLGPTPREDTHRLHLDAFGASVFGGLGLLVALAGALRPALEAARIPTASALKAGDVASGRVRTHPLLSVACLALAVLALALPPIADLPLQGYASIGLLLIALVIALPSILQSALSHAPRWRTIEYRIALAQLAGTARYATLSLAAIIVSFSLMVAMAIMVTSFRTSLDSWTQKVLPADIYVRAGRPGDTAHFDPEAVRRIAALPGIARLETSRYAKLRLSKDRPELTLIARTSIDPQQSLWIVAADSRPVPRGVLPVWINEAAGDLYGLSPGAQLALPLGAKRVLVQVRGIWRDYEYPSGAIVIERDSYVRLSGDRAVNTLWLWLDEGVSLAQVQAALRGVLPAQADYELRTPADIRRASLAAFDRTFAITYVLELVAVVIGLFGIAAGISAQVLARRGEFGALRHLGFTRGQIAAMLAIEGAVLGALGVILGLLAGALVSLVLIYVVNRLSFHWSMDLYAPYGLLAGLSLVLIGAAAGIAVLSGRRAMSDDVVRAVKEDW